MEVRRLGPCDSALLAYAVRSLIPEEERDGGAAGEEHLRRALENAACYFIVCLIGSAPAGYLSAFRFPAVDGDWFQVYLYDIVVGEGHRRLGIGSRMIQELKRLCEADGVDHIWLGTSLENEPARKTFERTGARKVGETYVEYVYTLGRRRT